jgi:hypothetical protein
MRWNSRPRPQVAFAVRIQCSYACAGGCSVAARFARATRATPRSDCVAGMTCQFNRAKIGANNRLNAEGIQTGGWSLPWVPAAHGRGARRSATERPGDPLRNAIVVPARRCWQRCRRGQALSHSPLDVRRSCAHPLIRSSAHPLIRSRFAVCVAARGSRLAARGSRSNSGSGSRSSPQRFEDQLLERDIAAQCGRCRRNGTPRDR